MLPVQTTYLRPRRTILLVLFLLCLVIVIIIAIQKNVEPVAQLILLMPVGGMVLIWLAYRKVLLVVDNEGLTHSGIFSTRNIKWSEVVKTYIRHQQHNNTRTHYWYFETPGQTLKFPTNFYSRKDIKLVAEAVVEKCAHAAIDDKIHAMANGRFPWYMF